MTRQQITQVGITSTDNRPAKRQDSQGTVVLLVREDASKERRLLNRHPKWALPNNGLLVMESRGTVNSIPYQTDTVYGHHGEILPGFTFTIYEALVKVYDDEPCLAQNALIGPGWMI